MQLKHDCTAAELAGVSAYVTMFAAIVNDLQKPEPKELPYILAAMSFASRELEKKLPYEPIRTHTREVRELCRKYLRAEVAVEKEDA